MLVLENLLTPEGLSVFAGRLVKVRFSKTREQKNSETRKQIVSLFRPQAVCFFESSLFLQAGLIGNDGQIAEWDLAVFIVFVAGLVIL